MDHAGLICSTKLDRFLSPLIIQELELNTDEYCLDDDINEDNVEDCAEAPAPLPTCFDFRLFFPLTSMLKGRPRTHELVDPIGDVIVPSQTLSTCGEAWPTWNPPPPTSSNAAVPIRHLD